MKTSFLLLHSDPGWRVAKVTDQSVELRDVPEQGEAAISAVSSTLKDWGYGGAGVCLGVPSSMVFAAQIDSTSLPRTQRRSAMLFRLEEKLPLDIEGLTTDFLPPAAGRSLGVAVETNRLAAVLEALTAAGAEPVVACPTALLALWQICRGGAAWDYVVLADERSVELFRLHDGQPVTWYTLPPKAADLLRCLRADQLARDATADASVRLVGRCDGLQEALSHEAGLRLDAQEGLTSAEPAALAAAGALTGERAGWVDLRRDALAAPDPWRRVGRLVSSAVVLALLLPLLSAGAAYWRATRYDASVQDARRQAEAVYRQLNRLPPEAPIVFKVRQRLEAELRRLAGVSGAAGQLPRQPNALETARKVVAGLPKGMRVRIVELNVEPGQISIEGQTTTHGDAEAIRAGLIRAGLNVEPPKTERLAAGGVSFTLVGHLPGNPAPGQPGGRP